MPTTAAPAATREPAFTGRLNYRETRNAGGWTGEPGFDVYSGRIYLGFVVPAHDEHGVKTGRWVSSKASRVGQTFPTRYAAANTLR